MPSGPQPRIPCCCTCNRKGPCLWCICVKNGKHCVHCHPSGFDTCSNYESSLPQSSIPTAPAQSSIDVQHVPSSVLSASPLAASAPHHSLPKAQHSGFTTFLYCMVSSLPSPPQGDHVNYANLLSSQTSTIPDLDLLFLSKLPTLQHVPKGGYSVLGLLFY